MIRVRRGLALGLLCAALSPVAGCGSDSGAPRNLLLVTVDTLRRDRLGYEGHDRPTSPAIDRLAAQGVRFERAYSQSGWTLPSLATVLTGRYPARHGAVDFHSALDPYLPTLATVLAGHGYDTRAFVSHVLLRPTYGLARGFASYDDSVLQVGNPHLVSTAIPLTDRVLEALASVRPPFFIWVHYFDPHFNYLMHPEWADFGSDKIDRYDQEIAYTDRQIGRLLAALRQSGHEDDTVVVFCADHGEEFGEHGGSLHDNLDEPVTHIPLVIRAPGLAPGVRAEAVQQIDLLPTILPLLRVEASGDWPGRNLLAPEPPDEPTLFLERVDPPPYLQRAVIRGRYKLVVAVRIEGAGNPEGRPDGPNVRPGVFLYDLEADPGETRNLFDEQGDVARELLALLHQHFGEDAGGPHHDVEVDEDLKAKLRALGYAP